MVPEFGLDNGTEYLTEDMKELMKKEKFILSPAPLYTPLNGTAECLNLSLPRIIERGYSKRA